MMFTERMERILENENELSAILEGILEECSCAVGTIHRFDPKTNALYMVAHHGLPAPLLERVSTIPMGKVIFPRFCREVSYESVVC